MPKGQFWGGFAEGFGKSLAYSLTQLQERQAEQDRFNQLLKLKADDAKAEYAKSKREQEKFELDKQKLMLDIQSGKLNATIAQSLLGFDPSEVSSPAAAAAGSAAVPLRESMVGGTPTEAPIVPRETMVAPEGAGLPPAAPQAPVVAPTPGTVTSPAILERLKAVQSRMAPGQTIKIGDLTLTGQKPDEPTELKKLFSERDAFVRQYGDKSPQVRAYDAVIRKKGTIKGDGTMAAAKLSDQATLRDDFTKQAASFVTVRDFYSRLERAASNPSAAGDLSMIFSFMKILDPTSAVREGEQASAQNTAGVPDQVRNIYNRVASGERLTPEQRLDFKTSAEAFFGEQLRTHLDTENEFRGIAQRTGIDPRNVVVDFVGKYRTLAPPSAEARSIAPGTRTNDLPDPAQYRGLQVLDTKTGGMLKSDGTKWVPMKQ